MSANPHAGLPITDDDAAIALQPSDLNVLAQAHAYRAYDLLALGRSDDAIKAATTAIELQPGDVNLLARSHLARSAALGDRYEEALADDDAAIALKPTAVSVLAEAYFYRGVDLSSLGREVEADLALAKACELGFDDAPVC